jgi:hypothetical protein
MNFTDFCIAQFELEVEVCHAVKEGILTKEQAFLFDQRRAGANCRSYDHSTDFAMMKPFHALSFGRPSGLNGAECGPAATLCIDPGWIGRNVRIPDENEPGAYTA